MSQNGTTKNLPTPIPHFPDFEEDPQLQQDLKMILITILETYLREHEI